MQAPSVPRAPGDRSESEDGRASVRVQRVLPSSPSRVRDAELRVEARAPEQIGKVELRRLPVLGLWDIEAIGTKAPVRLSA